MRYTVSPSYSDVTPEHLGLVSHEFAGQLVISVDRLGTFLYSQKYEYNANPLDNVTTHVCQHPLFFGNFKKLSHN